MLHTYDTYLHYTVSYTLPYGYSYVRVRLKDPSRGSIYSSRRPSREVIWVRQPRLKDPSRGTVVFVSVANPVASLISPRDQSDCTFFKITHTTFQNHAYHIFKITPHLFQNHAPPYSCHALPYSKSRITLFKATHHFHIIPLSD